MNRVNTATAPLSLLSAIMRGQEWRWVIFLFLWGTVLCFVRLFNLLAFEFAFACALPLSFLGARCTLLTEALTPWLKWRRGTLRALKLGLIPLIPIIFNGLRVRNCNWGEGLLFYCLISAGAIVVASGWAVVISLWSRRRGVELTFAQGIKRFTLIFILSLIWGVSAFLFTPSVDVFSTFMGYYPGALYDEDLMIGPRLVLSRFEDLATVCLLIAALSSQLFKRTLLVSLIVFAWGWSADLHRPAWWIQKQMGGEASTHRFTLHYPEEWDADHVEEMKSELTFNFEELEEFFGFLPDQPVHIYLYTSATHKKRLMGAGQTLIAKPWRYEIHVHSPFVGDRVITHELAHVFSAVIAPSPHHLSLWNGILPNMSLIEGLAVAAAWTRGRGGGLMSRLTPHQWTAAMRRLELAPPLSELLVPYRFYAYNARLAYTMCGSFVRFYQKEEGRDHLNQLYFDGGRREGVDQAIERWEQWLDRLPLDPKLLSTASALLDYPSIFRKVCAHELAARRNEAVNTELKGDLEGALSLWKSVDQDAPHDAEALLRRVELFHRLKRPEDALQLVTEELSTHEIEKTLDHLTLLRLREWRIDLELTSSLIDTKTAKTRYAHLQELVFSRPSWRRLAIKQYATSEETPEELSVFILGALNGHIKGDEYLEKLTALTQAWETHPELHYLLGRALQSDQSWGEASAHFNTALTLGLGYISLTYEAERSLAMGYFQQQKYQLAAEKFAQLAQRADLEIEEGEREELILWSKRALSFRVSQGDQR